MISSEGSLFFPDKSKKIADAYPELAKNDKIKVLSKEEGDFCWWFSCKASPLVTGEHAIQDRQRRAQEAFDRAFGINADVDVRVKYYSLQFPPEVMEGNDAMSKFDPSYRARANDAVENIFSNLLKISNLNVDNIMYRLIDGEEVFDASAVNQYVNSIQKIREELPEVIKLREEGFGINAAVSMDLASGKSAHEIAMQRRKEKKK